MTAASILVVEDEAVVAKDLEVRLLRLGYGVAAVVASGRDAVAKVQELRPNLVLMDIMLKGEMDGIATVEAIHANLNIPVVFLTAYGDDETRRRAKATAPFGYVLKPFDEQQLDIALEMALNRSAFEEAAKETAQLRAAMLLALSTAHEIATPLAVIRAALEAVNRPGRSDGPDAKQMETALKAADQIQHIVTRLGRIARIETTQTSPDRPPMLDIRKSSEPL